MNIPIEEETHTEQFGPQCFALFSLSLSAALGAGFGQDCGEAKWPLLACWKKNEGIARENIADTS